jgi:hypothetical protein
MLIFLSYSAAAAAPAESFRCSFMFEILCVQLTLTANHPSTHTL